MPYKSLKDANSAIRGIKPPVTLEQANHIAEMADSIDAQNGWPIAISTFKKEYTVRGGKWVKRQDVQEARAQEVITKLAKEWTEKMPITAAEQATLKAQAKNLLSSLDEILGTKGVSPAIRKSASDLKAALKKNWGDMKDCKPDEKPEEVPGEEETEENNPVPAAVQPEETVETQEEEEKPTLSEVAVGLNTLVNMVRDAFRAQYPYNSIPSGPAIVGETPYAVEVFLDHPTFGSAVVAEIGYRRYMVPFDMSPESGVTFAPRNEWKEVVPTYVYVPEAQPASSAEGEAESAPVREAEIEIIDEAVLEEKFVEDGELMNNLVQLEEADGGMVTDDVPLRMKVAFVYPGFGNKRDNHYYSADMLQKNAGKFKGVKMYESDHRPSEKSTRTWVSTVEDIAGFTKEGAPIAKVVVHEPTFAKRVRALSAAGQLQKLECSILANGKARKGKVDGVDAKIVEEITDVESVDWVTRAGAGGKALQLTESDTTTEKEVPMSGKESEQVVKPPEETPAPVTETVKPEEVATPTVLAETEVKAELEKVRLPEVTKTKLAKGSYATVDALKEAINVEVEYLKEVTASGKPFEQSGESKPTETKLSEAEYESKMKAIGEKYGLGLYSKEEVNNGS